MAFHRMGFPPNLSPRIRNWKSALPQNAGARCNALVCDEVTLGSGPGCDTTQSAREVIPMRWQQEWGPSVQQPAQAHRNEATTAFNGYTGSNTGIGKRR